MALITKNLECFDIEDIHPLVAYEGAKFDQIRVTVTNTRIYKMGNFQTLTRVIHRRNSEIYNAIKAAPEGMALRIRVIEEAFKELYILLGIGDIEPHVFLTKISFHGGKSKDGKKDGSKKPSCSYTLHTDIGDFVVQHWSVEPFNSLLIFNPIKIAKKIYTLKTGKELPDDNILDDEAYRCYEDVITLGTNETNLTTFIVEPFFRFLMPWKDLQQFKFRYWLCYAEICYDVKADRVERGKIIKSAEDLIRDYCRRVVTKCYDDEDWVEIIGDYREKGKIQIKIYPKRMDYIRVELTYTSSYMKDAEINRRLNYKKWHGEDLGIFSDLMKSAKQWLNKLVTFIKEGAEKSLPLLPEEYTKNYIAHNRRMIFSEPKIKVYEYLTKVGIGPIKRQEICEETGLKSNQVANVLRQIPHMLEYKKGSYKFEVTPEGKEILKRTIEFFKSQSSRVYAMAKNIREEFAKKIYAVRWYGGDAFIQNPIPENYRAMKECVDSII